MPKKSIGLIYYSADKQGEIVFKPAFLSAENFDQTMQRDILSDLIGDLNALYNKMSETQMCAKTILMDFREANNQHFTLQTFPEG